MNVNSKNRPVHNAIPDAPNRRYNRNIQDKCSPEVPSLSITNDAVENSPCLLAHLLKIQDTSQYTSDTSVSSIIPVETDTSTPGPSTSKSLQSQSSILSDSSSLNVSFTEKEIERTVLIPDAFHSDNKCSTPKRKYTPRKAKLAEKFKQQKDRRCKLK